MAEFFLRNQSPEGYGAEADSLISVDVLHNTTIFNPSYLDAYVNGIKVFKGPNTFIAPYNGSQSSITSIDGYNGYHLVLDNTGEFSPSSSYTVRITAHDGVGNTLDDSFIFKTYTHIVSIGMGLYEIALNVTFGRNLLNNLQVTKPANYVFDNEMYVRFVDWCEANVVRLWVELFYEYDQFTLTVSDNIKDIDGYALPASLNSITIDPFESTAMMGNFNGRVRTWRESNLVSADSDRIYLAGTKGIDVFKKEGELIPSRWAQVFDAYGINSMFVAHFGGDYEFTDTDPPYFSYQDPSPGDTAQTDTDIQFILSDVVTAMEIPSLTIYVNEMLAFSGGFGGWANEYSGTIQIGYQELIVVLNPPVPFSDGEEVEVRVLVQDLLENALDSSYNFTTVTIVLSGFGVSEFGVSSFGGI